MEGLEDGSRHVELGNVVFQEGDTVVVEHG